MAVSSFYGRQEELTRLSQWVVQERCRGVTVLGPGGIGKSVLAVMLMQQAAEQFQVVLFRSLRDAPPPEAWLSDFLQALAPEPLAKAPVRLEAQLRLLLDFLRE